MLCFEHLDFFALKFYKKRLTLLFTLGSYLLCFPYQIVFLFTSLFTHLETLPLFYTVFKFILNELFID
jgi:hypothetical protein